MQQAVARTLRNIAGTNPGPGVVSISSYHLRILGGEAAALVTEGVNAVFVPADQLAGWCDAVLGNEATAQPTPQPAPKPKPKPETPELEISLD